MLAVLPTTVPSLQPTGWTEDRSLGSRTLRNERFVAVSSLPAVEQPCSMEAYRDEGGMVRGEGVGVGVLSAPEGAGTSPTVDLQPSLRCSGIMLKISFGLPKLLLRRCGRLAAVGCDAAGCFTPWCSSTMRARALA